MEVEYQKILELKRKKLPHNNPRERRTEREGK